jgi:predicted DNA-binding transcriptional regulator YafY
MYHPTSRVLAVLELLQAHPQLSGPELAARLEVDVRTVRRYITMLQDLGVPIEGTIGRYGGYRLLPGYKLPPLMFNDDEALALTMGLMVARRLGLAAAAPAVEGALAKVERVLPEGVRTQVQAINDTLTIDLPVPEVMVASAILGALSHAAKHTQQVWVSYSGREGMSERLVDPYGVVYHGGRWYMVGYCHLREDRRVFRVDRIEEIQARAGTFCPPPPFDLVDYVRRSFAVIPDRWEVRVHLDLPLAEAQRRLPSGLALLEPDDAGVILRAAIHDLDWMARTLAGVCCRIRVLEPPELRAAFRRLAQELYTLAAGDEDAAPKAREAT